MVIWLVRSTTENSEQFLSSDVTLLLFGPSEQFLCTLVVTILMVNIVHLLLKFRTFLIETRDVSRGVLKGMPQVVLIVHIIYL